MNLNFCSSLPLIDTRVPSGDNSLATPTMTSSTSFTKTSLLADQSTSFTWQELSRPIRSFRVTAFTLWMAATLIRLGYAFKIHNPQPLVTFAITIFHLFFFVLSHCIHSKFEIREHDSGTILWAQASWSVHTFLREHHFPPAHQRGVYCRSRDTERPEPGLSRLHYRWELRELYLGTYTRFEKCFKSRRRAFIIFISWNIIDPPGLIKICRILWMEILYLKKRYCNI